MTKKETCAARRLVSPIFKEFSYLFKKVSPIPIPKGFANLVQKVTLSPLSPPPILICVLLRKSSRLSIARVCSYSIDTGIMIANWNRFD